MICNKDCKNCRYFIKDTIECSKNKKLIVVEFDFEIYMNNLSNMVFEKYDNEDDYHYDNYDDISSFYVLRKKSPFYIDIGKINNELEKYNIKIEVLELNCDNIGEYLLIKKMELN